MRSIHEEYSPKIRRAHIGRSYLTAAIQDALCWVNTKLNDGRHRKASAMETLENRK